MVWRYIHKLCSNLTYSAEGDETDVVALKPCSKSGCSQKNSVKISSDAGILVAGAAIQKSLNRPSDTVLRYQTHSKYDCLSLCWSFKLAQSYMRDQCRRFISVLWWPNCLVLWFYIIKKIFVSFSELQALLRYHCWYVASIFHLHNHI